jgi:subtilisin family serine protease
LRVRVSGDDLAVARGLRGVAGVEHVTPDLVLPLVPAALPDDPWVGEEWHLENTGQGGRTADVDIDAELAWNFATGAGQTIAIIDSGTQLDHPDLSVIAGHDYVDGDDAPDPGSDPYNAHGTGTAGIAAAIGGNGIGVAGVAYDADVYAIRLIGGDTSIEDLYNAFIEAVDAGAAVLSNSWGFGADCSGIPAYDTFRDMFNYAEDYGRGGLGAAVVFAAGNAGCDIDADGMLNHRKIVVVAALESTDTRASYSNYGDVVDIAAPTALLTTDIAGGYGSYGGDDAYADGFSGTSGATPVVAGVMALMFEANPRLTAKQAREAMYRTATRVDHDLAGYDADGWSPYYGHGRVDAGAAVAAVANTAPQAPVPRWVADTAELPHVRVAWQEAVDPDNDVGHYVVRWTVTHVDGAVEAQEATTTDTMLDVSEGLVVGDVVRWSVAAVDPWGEGLASAELSLEVVPVSAVAVPDGESAQDADPASPQSGCAAVGRRGVGDGVGLLIVAGMMVARRIGRAARGR